MEKEEHKYIQQKSIHLEMLYMKIPIMLIQFNLKFYKKLIFYLIALAKQSHKFDQQT